MTDPIPQLPQGEIDQLWECPRCGAQVGMGSPAQLHPPFCRWGHARAEMEQVRPTRFARQFDDEGTDG